MSWWNGLGKLRWLVVAITATAIGLGIYWKVGKTSPDVAYFEVKADEFVVDIQETGELKAEKSRMVSVPRRVWGNIQIVKLAPEGSVVREGDFLVQFDTAEFQQKLDERKNRLQNALVDLESEQARVKSAMAQLESALATQRFSYQQAKLRFEQMQYEAESKRKEQELELKKAELQLKQAEEKIESQKIIDEANTKKLQIKVNQARLELEEAESRFSGLTLHAPIAGLVVYKEIWKSGGRSKIKVGDTPWRGQELVEIPDLSIMQVKTQVNEVHINRVALGQQVIITVDALPEATFYGTVTRVATLAQRKGESEVKVFDIEVTIDGSDDKLRPGMNASCRIVTDRIEDALFVPLESVFEKDGRTVVYKKGRGTSPTEVKVGLKNSDHVIIEEGVEVGESVALRDPTKPLEDVGAEGQAAPAGKKPKKKNRSETMIIIG